MTNNASVTSALPPHPPQPIMLGDDGEPRYRVNRIIKALIAEGIIDLDAARAAGYAADEIEQLDMLSGRLATAGLDPISGVTQTTLRRAIKNKLAKLRKTETYLILSALQNEIEEHLADAEALAGYGESQDKSAGKQRGLKTALDAVNRAILNYEAGPFGMQPLYLDERDELRFRGNKIICDLIEKGLLDLNKVAMGDFDRDERMQFAQLVAYSLNGYSELSYVTRENFARASDMAEELLRKTNP